MVTRLLSFFGYEKVHAGNKLASLFSIKQIDDPEQLRSIASHEIGHLLIYLTLRDLPKDIKVEIKIEKNGELSGRVTCGLAINPDQARSIRVLGWIMLVSLGGMVAENVNGYPRSAGCSYDMDMWLEAALLYQRSFANGIHYSNPSSQAELEFNESKLVKLQQGQIHYLSKFIKLNARIHNELTEKLMEMKVLNLGDLSECKSKIIIPKDFPMPDFSISAE